MRMLKKIFLRLAPTILFISVLLFWTGCSKKSSLEVAVENASTEIETGAQIVFFRLSNDALVENVTVRKVEKPWLFISDNTGANAPFWLNLDEVVSFREKDAADSSARADSAVALQADAAQSLRKIRSLKEFAEIISRIEIALPGGKKWEELGILERKDWAEKLSNQVPDVLFPASLKVGSASDMRWFGNAVQIVSMKGTGQLKESDPAEFTVSGCPQTFRLTAPKLGDRLSFSPTLRDGLASLKSGDDLEFWQVLRVTFSVDDEGSEMDMNFTTLDQREL